MPVAIMELLCVESFSHQSGQRSHSTGLHTAFNRQGEANLFADSVGIVDRRGAPFTGLVRASIYGIL